MGLENLRPFKVDIMRVSATRSETESASSQPPTDGYPVSASTTQMGVLHA